MNIFKIYGTIKYRVLRLLGIEHSFDRRKKLILELLPNNPIIIDCGAHDGSDSVKFAKLLPNCTIHSFEPIPEIYQKLVKNTKTFKNIFTYNLAISDVNGEVIMNISEGASDASSSILDPKEHLKSNPDVVFSRKVSVKTQTFDTWIGQTNVSHIDFMWLDMQGYELPALKHGTELLKGCSIIYTEVSQIEDYKNQGLYEELVIFLKSQNFIVYREFFDYGKQGDVIFMKVKNEPTF